MTSQTSKQMITIYILLKISITKGNQEMKFGQLIEYNMRNVFQKNLSENVAERLAPHLFLIFKKALCKVKVSGQQFCFKIFGRPPLGDTTKIKLCNISGC